MHRPTLTLIAVLLILPTAAIGPAAGQSAAVDNATDAVDDAVTDDADEATNETQLLYEFEGGGALRSVEYREGSTWVTVAATDGDQRFAVSEGDLQSTGSFEYMTVSVDAGESRTVELPVAKSSVVVTTTQDGFYYQGSSGPTVLTDRPTEELLQITGISGVVGSVWAAGAVFGLLKRRHQNNYKELFSDERKKIERDAFEGWRERLVSWLSDRSEHKLSTIAGVSLLGYIGLVVVGQAPPPGDLWLELGDFWRVVLVGTLTLGGLALFPMYYLADRFYDPDSDFVIDLDSKDVYKAKSGDKSGEVSVYSGPPDQISDMEVDGGVTTVDTPGGRAHLVRGFDPEENTAAGNPPELDNDRLVSIRATHIDKNRGVLQELALIGRDLIGEMTNFRVVADTKAMKDIDEGLRGTVSAGEDSLDDVLGDVVEGTRYEGAYKSPDQLLEQIEDDLPSDIADKDPGEIEESNDPATNGADQ